MIRKKLPPSRVNPGRQNCEKLLLLIFYFKKVLKKWRQICRKNSLTRRLAAWSASSWRGRTYPRWPKYLNLRMYVCLLLVSMHALASILCKVVSSQFNFSTFKLQPRTPTSFKTKKDIVKVNAMTKCFPALTSFFLWTFMSQAVRMEKLVKEQKQKGAEPVKVSY